MEGAYEVDYRQFFFNRTTNVRLYYGFSLECDCLHVLIKCHDIYLVEKTQFLEDFNFIVNTGLAQTRVDHPNARTILEIRPSSPQARMLLRLSYIGGCGERCRELVERPAANQPYTESDSDTFLKQTTEALAHARAKGIAPRDTKQGYIFMDAHGSIK